MKKTQLIATLTMLSVLASAHIQAMDSREQRPDGSWGFRVQPEFQTGTPERTSSFADWRASRPPNVWAPQMPYGSVANTSGWYVDSDVKEECNQISDQPVCDNSLKWQDLKVPKHASELTEKDLNEIQEFIEKDAPGDKYDLFYRLRSTYAHSRNTIAKAALCGCKNSTYLQVAVDMDDRKLVEYLLICGLNANAKTGFLSTPMLDKVQSVPVATLLQQYGANIAENHEHVGTVIHYACQSKFSSDLMVHYINELKKLKKLEYCINAQQCQMNTPLHKLIYTGGCDFNFVERLPEMQKKLALLLENGADCMRQNWEGKTPNDRIKAIVADIKRYSYRDPKIADSKLSGWAAIATQLAPVMEAQLQAQAARRATVIQAQSSCAICLEGFEDSAMPTALPCAHAFHPACIQAWTAVKKECPTCRTKIVEQSNSNNNG